MSTPSGPPSIDQLRAAVLREGGDWTRARAVDFLGGRVTHERARQILNRLTTEGLLVRHGPQGYLWTPPPPTSVDELAAAICQRARTIPGITSAELTAGAGAVTVRHADGRIYLIQVSEGGDA